MSKVKYSYKDKEGIELKGWHWKAESPKANLIIVTGMEEHSDRYDEFATFLNGDGIDVYCVDHYAQGRTAGAVENLGKAPKDYFNKMVENINNIAASLKKTKLPVYLFGHSMGSFVSQAFIEKHSEAIDKVVLSGTDGPNDKLLFGAGAFMTKLLVNKKNFDKKGTFFINLSFGPYHKRFPEHEFAWLSVDKKNVEKYALDPYCGYGSSNGFFKGFLNGNAQLFKKKNLQNIRKDLPVLIISGADDPVGAYGKGPKTLSETYLKLGIKNTTLILHEGIRHELLNDLTKEKGMNEILEFLNK